MKKTGKKTQPIHVFDDALPERLLAVTDALETGARVHLRTGEVEPSPFIVKLSRQGEAAPVQRIEEDPIAALAKSFIIEHDDVLDEAPLMVADASGDGLTLSLEDLREQMREDECAFQPIVSGAGKIGHVYKETLDDAVPVDIWSSIPAVDVVEVFETTPVIPVQIEPAPVPMFETLREELTAPESIEVERVPVATVFVRRGNGWQRALAAFVGLALAAVLPLHALQVLADTRVHGGEVESASKAALATFLRGATSLSSESFDTAGQDFSEAAQGFAEAESSLNDLNLGITALASVIPETDRTVESARALVTAGRELSDTAAIMSAAAHDLSDKDSIELSSKLDLLGAYIENALPHAEAAAEALRHVDAEVVPIEYANSVIELQQRAPQVAASMAEYVQFVDTFSLILGGQEKMRYLAVFQNNTELRPTGGFMGSFAEMDVDRGEVVRMFVPTGGTYDVQGQLQAYVAAPGPLQLLKARWEFQDANWFPDFPSSAKKMRWFYSESGGPTVDGVVAVNATFVADLLRLLGPVEMPKYGRTFDAENFVFETQKIVELEYDKVDNAPKEVIGDLAPILLDRMQTADTQTLMAVVDLIAKGLKEKDILLNFRDNDLQASIESLGWSGAVKQTSGDYLMVVNTNLGGGKTDGVIDQDVQVDVNIAADGSLENTVTITKTHRGMKTALFSGSNNVDYLRLYVPRGSELLSASGFEIPADELFETPDTPLSVDTDLELHMQDLKKDPVSGTDIWQEDGKTVFGNWMQTASGETQVVTFTYRTPVTVFDQDVDTGALVKTKQLLGLPELGEYTLFVQKQPGVVSRNTHVDVRFPENMSTLWSSTGEISPGEVEISNATDHYFGWVVERN